MSVMASHVGAIADQLDEGRTRTLDLLASFDDDFLVAQHSPLMSPLVWDLAHVANYEDLWLVRALGHDGVAPQLDDLYDAFRHPRRDRRSLPLLDPAGARAYVDEVRTRALAILDGGSARPDDDRLLDDGFVYGMVIQHEHQHDETMLATIQLSGAQLATASHGPGAVPSAPPRTVDGGAYVLGTNDVRWAYDNERPAHTVELEPFAIDASPVTNATYQQFIAAGGYDHERLWHPDGWTWRTDERARGPLFWDGDGAVVRFAEKVALDPDEPVQHVCWYEADACARWMGRRLPTEAEWEAAAPSNSGHVWEWTASSFQAWPGFESFPYREYSEVFFGPDYKVLRGGSWATHPSANRRTFRNWDFPIRRQIFAGFRCASDV